MSTFRLDPWLLLAAAAALLALPVRVFPPQLLAGFAIPGVLFAVLALPRFAVRLRFELRISLAIATQIALTAIVVARVEPLRLHHALTLNLVAPLVYLSLRRRPGSLRLALFLALCMLWIGLMADRNPSLLPAVLFALGGTLALQAEARREATDHRGLLRFGGAAPWRQRAAAAGIALATLCVVLGLLPLLRLLEKPGVARRPASVGVGSDFELDRAAAGPLRLTSDQLVLVERKDRQPVAADLYLRCAAFEVAGLDSWRPLPGAAADLALVRSEPIQLRVQPVTETLLVTPLDQTRELVFVPAHAAQIRGLAPILVDFGRELLQAEPDQQISWFEVDCSDPPPREARIDFSQRSLLRLPDQLAAAELKALLLEFTGGRGRADLATARRIAQRLRARCSYELAEPTGPHRHALQNFLFGDRRGYCMHFASAYAAFLRLQGIPCRIGVGLHGGAPDVDHEQARLYGSRHAHAWVEIPLQQYGFAVFDPTPAANLTADEERWPPARLDGGEAAGSGWERIDAILAPAGVVLGQSWPLFALLVLLLLARGGAGWRRGAGLRSRPDAAGARRLLDRLLRELARRGQARAAGQTLEAFARSLRLDAGERAPITGALAAYQEVRFGARPFDSARAARLQDGLTAAARLQRETSNG